MSVAPRAGRWEWIVCTTIEFMALGVWVGGLTVLVGAVIPAVFNTFGGQDTGGLFLTRAFEGYNRLVMGAMAALFCGALWRMRIARRGLPAARVSRLEWILVGSMVAIAVVIIFVLHPEAAARQAEAFALTDTDARKAALVTFFKVHQPIRWLYVINLVLGVTLMGVKARSWLMHLEAAV